jgi:hypothetical protein
MRKCQGCNEEVATGYSKNPVTGRESKFDFYCDPCYERGMQRDSQSREYQKYKTRQTSRKEANRHEERRITDN